MACASCLQHRANIKTAIKQGNVTATVKATAQAGVALVQNIGENAGRRLVRRKSK
jgi:hypothetical protein